MCLLTNERYYTYETGFTFSRLGHAPGVGLEGVQGGWRGSVFVFQNSTKFGVSYSNELHMQQHNFFAPRRWGGTKRSNITKFQLLFYIGQENRNF